MNAKKIMGAVLVALLAAALFVGAGAAATAAADGTTVFVNQKLSETIYGGNWVGSNGAVTPTPADEANIVYFPAGTEGVYTLKNGTTEYTLTVKSPEITISGVAGEGVSAYKFIGGIFYQGEDQVDVKINQLTTLLPVAVYMTVPNGAEELIGNNVTAATAIQSLLNKSTAPYPAVGEYSIRAVYNASNFVNGTLYTALVTKPVTFTVAEAGAVTIAASVDKVIKSEPIKITITGQPGYIYNVSYDAYAFKGSGDQLGLPGVSAIGTTVATKNNFSFEMPNTGAVEFMVKGNVTDKTEKLSVKQLVPAPSSTTKTQSVVIEFAKGTISGKTDAASYFVGDKVKVTGTTSDGHIKNITLKGTNFEALLANTSNAGELQDLQNAFTSMVKYGAGIEETFEFEINTGVITNQFSNFQGKKLDVGTYSLTLETENAKTAVAVVLKQPFISILSAPEVIVQGDEAEFVINAEASPNGIAFYIFGTNFFAAGKQPNADEGVTNQFTVTLEDDDTKADKMAAGQYFAVFQHPMYDKAFNIYAIDGDFYLNTTGNAAMTVAAAANETYLFSFDARQTANAAQALCDNLDSQTIDDMYVKASFFVVGEDESFSISEIPTTVAQGETITVSGVSTAAAGDVVQVEMISTAFAAVPKETVGSAAFIVVTTTVAEDGTWEVTLDTSDLNVDEYSLKVVCDDDTWKNTKVNVVEAADKPVDPEQPGDEPEQPGDEPEAPATPGFGALAALAGLGAVAVLLLRRE